jgi:hypothetical protein
MHPREPYRIYVGCGRNAVFLSYPSRQAQLTFGQIFTANGIRFNSGPVGSFPVPFEASMPSELPGSKRQGRPIKNDLVLGPRPEGLGYAFKRQHACSAFRLAFLSGRFPVPQQVFFTDFLAL